MKEDNTNTINMVENHIRTLNVIDDGVLDTLKKISRRSFVPEKYKAFAHIDMSIPIGLYFSGTNNFLGIFFSVFKTSSSMTFSVLI